MLNLKKKLLDLFSFRGSESEDFSEDLPLRLLSDLSGNDAAIVREYKRLVSDPTAAYSAIDHLEEDFRSQPIPRTCSEFMF